MKPCVAFKFRPGAGSCDECGAVAWEHDFEWHPGPTPFDGGTDRAWPAAYIAGWLHNGDITDERFYQLVAIERAS